MSKSLAIAATTATLRNLLLKEVPKADSGLPQGFEVKTLPPDVAATKITGDNPALNLFLYQTQLNAAWRNQDMPLGTRPGETAILSCYNRRLHRSTLRVRGARQGNQ